MKRYNFIREHSGRFSVTRMASVLGVSRSGYYTWQKTRLQSSQWEQARKRLDRRVKEVFGQGKQRDGARRIQATLAADGYRYDVKTVGASMRRQALVPKAARKFGFFVTSCGFGLIKQVAYRAADQVDHGDEVGLVTVAACA